MRKLLALMLPVLLAGCKVTWSDPKPVENPAPVPVIIARGTNGAEVDWTCQLEDMNPALVWVSCDFQNKLPRAVAPACIQVTFYSEATGKPVASSRTICSGILPAHETFRNYAAFRNENRVALRSCGELLDLCTMLAGPSNEVR